jgi:hypothetical protein
MEGRGSAQAGHICRTRRNPFLFLRGYTPASPITVVSVGARRRGDCADMRGAFPPYIARLS